MKAAKLICRSLIMLGVPSICSASMIFQFSIMGLAPLSGTFIDASGWDPGLLSGYDLMLRVSALTVERAAAVPLTERLTGFAVCRR